MTMIPPMECGLCPRLAAFRAANRAAFPDFHNGPVSPFGPDTARLLVVGLAPGLKGANRTGRPFTGDFAGDLLYRTLEDFGFSQGKYAADPDDGLTLRDCRIINAVRCVPPENKPTGAEVSTCRRFLEAELAAMPHLAVIVALGQVAHRAVIAALGGRQVSYPFGHGNLHEIDQGDGPSRRKLVIADSYHCSRYNTNTGRLTDSMFQDVFSAVRQALD